MSVSRMVLGGIVGLVMAGMSVGIANADADPVAPDNTIPPGVLVRDDLARDQMIGVSPRPDAELFMIELQSLMSERQRALQIAQGLDPLCEECLKNMGN